MWKLFRILILRPLGRDLPRSSLTLLAVALGISVVVAIDLAGNAAAGSFESSLATVAGKTDLEILANGGVDEAWMGSLTALPVNARFTPAIEATVDVAPVGYVTLYGTDFIGGAQEAEATLPNPAVCEGAIPALVTRRLAGRLPRRFPIEGHSFCVAQTVDSRGSDFIAADIAGVQLALGRFGKIDRIDVTLEKGESAERVETALRRILPTGYQVALPGTRSAENRKMLGAFRWNLRILSYIALIVGAFLIYNTISISVVRRRPEIGILRALGAARVAILTMFLVEAALFGVGGALTGVVLGRALAGGLVSLIAQTVTSLYSSSSPAPIHLGAETVLLSLAAGLSVALLSAWAPAREAMRVIPVEAMGRGSREFRVRRRVGRNLSVAAVLASLAWAASFAGPVEGRPLFGYLAVLLSVASTALLAPVAIAYADGLFQRALRSAFGAAGLLASRGLRASAGRVSVVVSALATAIAMMASVAIMVGSFRQTVLVWLGEQLRADLYIRAAGAVVAGEYPPISDELPRIVRAVPGVDAVDEFTAIEFRYQGQRATLGAGDLDVRRRYSRLRFTSGDANAILDSLRQPGHAIVSEPFAEKHGVHVGDRLVLPLGPVRVPVTVMGVYFEYSSEQGYVILDRSVLLRYLPGEAPTNLAVYLRPGVDAEAVREHIQALTARFPIVISPNALLRREAVAIFDRTFAVTWALEGVAIIVAMLGAANALLALVLDRRRELGMLRYLGADARQMRTMILVEAGLLGLFALALGSALGLVLSRLLIFVINKQSFGWTIQFHFPAAALGGAMLLIWAVTILAGLYPARVAVRLKPIEAVHEE